jgi:hypothetical protein
MTHTANGPAATLRDRIEVVLSALRLLLAPGQVVELRILKANRGYGNPATIGGFYDTNHLAEMARTALAWTEKAAGVYYTINPLDPNLLARRCNTVDVADSGILASDQDVQKRQWLYIDADPIRDSHISASDDEKEAAAATAGKVRDFLAEQGWPAPVEIDSGNGFHLEHRIDLPVDDGGLIKRVLEALAAWFNTDKVKIDCSVFNPARINKVPGTLARKGSDFKGGGDAPPRPHRRARVLKTPGDATTFEQIPVVPKELLERTAETLERLAAERHAAEETDGSTGQTKPSAHQSNGHEEGEYKSRLDVPRWLSDRGVSFKAKPKPDKKGRTVFLLEPCPFDSSHTNTDSCIMQDSAGKLSAHCFHDSCHDRGWQEFKNQIGAPESNHYDPPLKGRKKNRRGLKMRAGGDSLEDQGNGAGGPAAYRVVNFEDVDIIDRDDGGKEKKKTIRVGLAASVIFERLRDNTGGWPKRVNDRLFVSENDKAVWLDKTESFFAWIGRTLPNEFANPITWGKGASMPTRAEFFAAACQVAERFDAVEALPHWPPIEGVYYLHGEIPHGDGAALNKFLGYFLPASDVDADCIRALAETGFWGGPPGQRPAFMAETEAGDERGGRGAGKSKLMQFNAKVAGGHMEVRPNENFNDVVTRLLSPAAADKRFATIDNVKTLKLSWADLESLITADVISGRQMYVGEGQRPNLLTWCLTFNGASMSRDMSQRTIPIRIKRPRHDPSWDAEVAAFVEAHQWEIIADIITDLKRPAPALEKFSRWARWEAGVLARVSNPAAAQAVIAERQESIDDDHAESDVVRSYFVRELTERGHFPDTDGVFIDSRTAALMVNAACGEKYPTNKASSYLRTLSIKELRKSNFHGGERGWAWRGKDFPPDGALEKLRERAGFSRRAEGDSGWNPFP